MLLQNLIYNLFVTLTGVIYKWLTEYMAGYGKRPMWQWIAIYAVVGGIIYFLIYYFILAPKGGSPY